MHILLIEPDRVVADCIVQAFPNECTFSISATADGAIIQADKHKPDVVICELMLAGHSGTEFLYEFRTYSDWEDIPVVIYTSLPIANSILTATDWQKLRMNSIMYKPHTSIAELRNEVLGVASVV